MWMELWLKELAMNEVVEVMVESSQSDAVNDVKPAKRIISDISRFYYKKSTCASKRSSLSLDSVIVDLLMVRFSGSDQRLRKWVAGQAKIAQEQGLVTNKSVSRAVQENAIRLIADPSLVAQLEPESVAEYERQGMMAQWLGQGPNKSAAAQPKRL